MTDSILSQSKGSGNLPGQGSRKNDGHIFSDAHPTAAEAAQAPPKAPSDIRRAWHPTTTGLIVACLIAAAGAGLFFYQNRDDHNVPTATRAATREEQVRNFDAARREIEIQSAERTADDEAVKDAAEQSTVELEQALKRERDKTEKLARELAAARRLLETQATAAAEAGVKAADDQQLAILRRALQDAEASTARYQELLVQERARNQTLEQQLLAYQQTAPGHEGDVATKPTDSPETTPAPPPDKPAPASVPVDDGRLIVASAGGASMTMTAQQPAAPQVTGNPESARLMARASQLLIVGDVAAARIVLDRAVESGDVQALFALAETYDPLSLSAWGTLGTQGDAAKARELYAKALAQGIQEAKDRLNALRE